MQVLQLKKLLILCDGKTRGTLCRHAGYRTGGVKNPPPLRALTYFLNPVDEADLMALLEDDSQNTPVVCSCTEKCTAGKVNTNCALCKTDMTNCAGKEATPEETEQPDEPMPEKKNNVGGILILVLFLAAGGGGALWYFKLRKPKSSVKGGDELDEFDFDEDDEAEEYGDYEDADSASDPDEQENEE